MSEEDRTFAEEVLALFKRHGRVLDYDYTSGWFIERIGADSIAGIREDLGLPPCSA